MTASHTIPSSLPRASRTTVVILTHNYGRFLQQAIESVLAQTRAPARLIVVDDASDDDPASVVQPYLDRLEFHRVEFRREQRTRNYGLALAKTDYVLFLDADDYMAPQMVELLEDALDRHPQAKVAYCDKVVFGDEAVMKRLDLTPSWQAGAFSVRRLQFSNFVMSTSLIRRKSIEAFDERFANLTDWETWLGLLKDDSHAVYVSQPLLHYRVHGTNMSVRSRHFIERLKIMVKHRLIALQPFAPASGSTDYGRQRRVLVITQGSAHAAIAPWEALAKRNRWRVRAIIGVSTDSLGAAAHPIRAPGVVLLTTVAANLEDSLKRLSWIVGDMTNDAVIVTPDLQGLQAGMVVFDDNSDVVCTRLSESEFYSKSSLEDLGAFAMPPSTVRTLLYMAPAAKPTAFGRLRLTMTDFYARHIAWRFRHHSPPTKAGGH